MHDFLTLLKLADSEYVKVRRSCTRGVDGNSDGESMVASIERPTLALYRKSREVYDKTRYEKLMESRWALSVEF